MYTSKALEMLAETRQLSRSAMTEMASGGTLGDLLAARRRRRFVGRTSEVELFRVALESPEPQFLLLYLHGPPGIGKTACSMSCRDCGQVGASVVRLDRRDLMPSPQAVLQALEVLGVLEGQHNRPASMIAGS